MASHFKEEDLISVGSLVLKVKTNLQASLPNTLMELVFSLDHLAVKSTLSDNFQVSVYISLLDQQTVLKQVFTAKKMLL